MNDYALRLSYSCIHCTAVCAKGGTKVFYCQHIQGQHFLSGKAVHQHIFFMSRNGCNSGVNRFLVVYQQVIVICLTLICSQIVQLIKREWGELKLSHELTTQLDIF